MNLIFFLSLATITSIIFGEIGRFPFGGGSLSLTLTDLLVFLTIFFCVIWQLGIKKNFKSVKLLSLLFPFYLISLLSIIISNKFFGILYLARFILYSMFFWVGFLVVNEKKDRFLLINKFIMLAGAILSIVGFLQLLFFPDISILAQFGFDPHSNRLVSTFLDPNFLGAFLCLSLASTMICFKLSKNQDGRKSLIYALIILAGIILTFSRSAYLFLIFEILFLSLFLNKKMLILLLLILIFFAFVPKFQKRIASGFLIDQSSKERLISWSNGINAFSASPIFGIGFNNLRYFFQEKNLLKSYSLDGGHSGAGIDSSLLLVLATTGILGFLAYLYFWVRMFFLPLKNKTLKITSKAVLLGFLINSQFINSLFFPFIMLVLFVFFGALAGYEEENS